MAQISRLRLRFIVFWLTNIFGSSYASSQYGKLIGSFGDQSLHDVSGTIYAVDKSTLCVQGFSYDGAAPDATFYASTSDTPGTEGFIIPDENGLTTRLSSYRNENLILRLSDGTTLEDVKLISIWCDLVGADFGSIAIPPTFVFPAPRSIGELGFTPRVHNVHADDVIILNKKQIQFINLVYDGYGPAAYFWTGEGNPDPNDRRIPHPVGSSAILPRYNGEDVTITFPSDLSVADVHFIGLWCVAARQNFGHLSISAADVVNIPEYIAPVVENCQELLQDKFHISWVLNADNTKVILTFRGIVDEGEYMAFGISGSDTGTVMRGSDVTVVWIDPDTHTARAEDYYLSAYSQCIPETGQGACPDELQENGVNNVVLVSGKVRDGVTVIVVERPISTADPNDRTISLTRNVPISWGIGYINPTGHVAKHHTRTIGTVRVNFGSTSTCPDLVAPMVTPEPVDPWVIEPLRPAKNSVLTAHIGPAGGRRGYQGIVGQVGWGLAWYINDTIIPEIYVERGATYTFEVYGGDDASFLGTYHPFYISDARNGGYDQKMPSEKLNETIYAGPVEGTLCEYTGDEDPEQFATFDEYKETLTLSCQTDPPQPGVLTWTVAQDTPDTVYYQCYQHRFFGWEIHVTDPLSTGATPTAVTPSVSTESPRTSSPTTMRTASLPTTMRTSPVQTTTVKTDTPSSTIATRTTLVTSSSTDGEVSMRTEEPVSPWVIEPLFPANNSIMAAHIGPSGGQRGYQGIAGQEGADTAWYINGTLIPEIHVKCGETYLFLVYGGGDASTPMDNNPFYITNSPTGGYDQKQRNQKEGEKIFSGPVDGSLCEYTGEEDPDSFETFKEYKETLNLDCPVDRRPGVLRWTVADDTPETVYYQSFQNQYHGWKIHVSSGCCPVLLSLWILLFAVAVGLFASLS